MIEKVQKRNGETVAFNEDKIRGAISKAFTAEGLDVEDPTFKSQIESVVDDVKYSLNNKFNDLDVVSIENIQDLVELALMTYNKQVAKRYIHYRYIRNATRVDNDVIQSIISAESNDITKENANMNASTMSGMLYKVASTRLQKFTDECQLNKQTKEYVDNNLIHIHDKDCYATKSLTCLQTPLDKVFKNGIHCNHAECRPPKRIMTAAVMACMSIQTTQNEMHGGQAIPAFDYYMAPFVKITYEEILKEEEDFLGYEIPQLHDISKIKEYVFKPVQTKSLFEGSLNDQIENIRQKLINKTVKQVHQAMESFIHNMNTIHSRGGNQVVFSSVNFGTDTTPEGRCIIRELLISQFEGVGNGSTAIFPILIFKRKAGINKNPGDPNYDLYRDYSLKCTAKRLFPNFLNLDASFNQSDLWREDDPNRYMHEVATMGCRTRVFENRHGIKTSVGRGNLSFTTMNLPRLGLEVSRTLLNRPVADKFELFLKRLKQTMDVTAQQLYNRYIYQCTALRHQMPMVMGGLWVDSEKLKDTDQIKDVLKHGTLGIGYIGLAECLKALTGHTHDEDEFSQELGLKIAEFMFEAAKEYSEKYDLNYSILATPAEGLAGKFVKKDRKEFGAIPGVTDKDYYTNSCHTPVYHHISATRKAEIEGPYHKYARGGAIFYVEIDGDAMNNIDALDDIVRTAEANDCGYISINHVRHRCNKCGYEDGEHTWSWNDFGEEVCPRCGSTDNTYLARITGYLVGGLDKWNAGKLAEMKDRVKHT